MLFAESLKITSLPPLTFSSTSIVMFFAMPAQDIRRSSIATVRTPTRVPSNKMDCFWACFPRQSTRRSNFRYVEAVELPLCRGDRYVLYTDGLPESKSAAGEEFGLQRCKQFLESHHRLLTGEFADRLLSEISRWSARSAGGAQEDDMTLILLDCLEQA